MKVIKNCITCNIEFKSYDVGKRKFNIYCSNKCKADRQRIIYRKIDERNCKYCSKKFITKPSDPKKYCSRTCQHKSLIIYDKLTDDQRLDLLKTRFLKFVIKQDGCWSWTGATVKGYGVVTFNDKHNFAHRISWQIHNGQIPHKMHVLHKCDNKICSNPIHLFLGSHKDNMKDMRSKGYHRQYSKLNKEQVHRIRNMIESKMRLREIAEKFNVSYSTISAIKLMKSWKNLAIEN